MILQRSNSIPYCAVGHHKDYLFVSMKPNISNRARISPLRELFGL
jgi:hypothetical protein